VVRRPLNTWLLDGELPAGMDPVIDGRD
jgi:hypothetical protein